MRFMLRVCYNYSKLWRRGASNGSRDSIAGATGGGI
jgi:hypothetical protein